MRNKLITVLVLAAIIIISFLAGSQFGGGNAQKKSKYKVIGKVPSYTLTNQLGQKVSSRKFKGKIRVVSFLFPYCREYCPLIALNMVHFEQLLKNAHLTNRVQLISYDVDPSHTGPSQMRAFMKEYGWNPKNLDWQYLTGKPSEIKKIVRNSYYVSYQLVSEAKEDSLVNREKKEGTYIPSPQVQNKLADKVNPDYDVAHNDAIAIVDTKGRIRKIINGADHFSNQQLLNIVDNLLTKSRN